MHGNFMQCMQQIFSDDLMTELKKKVFLNLLLPSNNNEWIQFKPIFFESIYTLRVCFRTNFFYLSIKSHHKLMCVTMAEYFEFNIKLKTDPSAFSIYGIGVGTIITRKLSTTKIF